MIRTIAVAAIVLGFALPAAAADFQVKAGGSNSQGSLVGQASSAGTGNGAVVGGNGTINGQPLPTSGGGSDQTTSPGSRADEVQALHALEGRGRDK